MGLATAITALVACFGLVSGSSTMSSIVARTDSSACDANCMRRILYQTAYTSSATGIAHAMGAYNSSAWCFSDDNKDWCPRAINKTVSAIAGKAMNLTSISSDPKVVCGPACLVQQLADVSRQSAIDGMVWATRTINGTSSNSSATTFMDQPEPVKQLQWTIHHLVHNTSSTVNAEALQKAMDAYQPAEANARRSDESNDDDDKDKDLMLGLGLGLGIPSVILGPFLGYGATTVLDPILRGPASWLGKILSSATTEGVLGPSSWLRYVLGIAKKSNLSPELEAELARSYVKNIRGAPKNFEDMFDEPITEETESWLSESWPSDSYSSSVYSESTEATQYFLAETFNQATGAMEQEMWQLAKGVGNSPFARNMGDLGNLPYHVLDNMGQPLTVVGDLEPMIQWQNPALLRPIPDDFTSPASWAKPAPGSPFRLLKEASSPVLNSMGDPIMTWVNEQEASLPEILTLEPIVVTEGARAPLAYRMLDMTGMDIPTKKGATVTFQSVQPASVGLSSDGEISEFELNGDGDRGSDGDGDGDDDDSDGDGERTSQASTTAQQPTTAPTPSSETTAEPKPTTSAVSKQPTTNDATPTHSSSVQRSSTAVPTSRSASSTPHLTTLVSSPKISSSTRTPTTVVPSSITRSSVPASTRSSTPLPIFNPKAPKTPPKGAPPPPFPKLCTQRALLAHLTGKQADSYIPTICVKYVACSATNKDPSCWGPGDFIATYKGRLGKWIQYGENGKYSRFVEMNIPLGDNSHDGMTFVHPYVYVGSNERGVIGHLKKRSEGWQGCMSEDGPCSAQSGELGTPTTFMTLQSSSPTVTATQAEAPVETLQMAGRDLPYECTDQWYFDHMDMNGDPETPTWCADYLQ